MTSIICSLLLQMKLQNRVVLISTVFAVVLMLLGSELLVSAQEDTYEPTVRPTAAPSTRKPSFRPSRVPTTQPSLYPTLKPTKPPIGPPTFYPTYKVTPSIYDILEFSFDVTIHGSYWSQIDERASLTLRKGAADVMGLSYLSLKVQQTWSAFEANNDIVDDDGGRRLNDGSVVSTTDKNVDVNLEFTSYVLVVKHFVYLNIVDFPDIYDTNVLYNRLKYKLGNATYNYYNDPVAYNEYSQRVRYNAQPSQCNSSMMSSARMVSAIVGSPTVTTGIAKHTRAPSAAPTTPGQTNKPTIVGGGTRSPTIVGAKATRSPTVFDNSTVTSNSKDGNGTGTGSIGVLGVLGIVAALVYIIMCAGCMFMYYREKRRSEKEAAEAAAKAAAAKAAEEGKGGTGSKKSQASSNKSPSETGSEDEESILSNVLPETMNNVTVPPPAPGMPPSSPSPYTYDPAGALNRTPSGNNPNGNSLYGGMGGGPADNQGNGTSLYGNLGGGGGLDANGRPISPTGGDGKEPSGSLFGNSNHGNDNYPGSPRANLPPNVDAFGNPAPPPPPPMDEEGLIMPPPPPPPLDSSVIPPPPPPFYEEMDLNASMHSMPAMFSVSGDGLALPAPFLQVASPGLGVHSIGGLGGYTSFYNTAVPIDYQP